jgi:hypothetical protein
VLPREGCPPHEAPAHTPPINASIASRYPCHPFPLICPRHTGAMTDSRRNGSRSWMLLRCAPTVNFEGRDTVLEAKGQHDPCVAPCAVPRLEGDDIEGFAVPVFET